MTVTTRKKLPTRIGDVTVVPPLSTEVLVSWRNDAGEVEWWKAIVAEVTTVKKGKVVGMGVLVYDSRGAFKDCVSKVEFLYNEQNGRTVREVGMKSSECAWKMEGDDSSCSSGTASTSRVSSTDTGAPSVHESDNDSTRKHPRAPDVEHSHHQPKQRKVVHTADESEGVASPAVDTEPVNVQHVPSQLTATQIMGNVATEYAHVLNSLALKTNAPANPDHVFVLKAELKHKLAERLSTNPTHTSATRFTQEGASIQRITVSITCCLQWFSDLVNDLNATINNEDLQFISFLPELRLLQKPSLASTELHVYFPTFQSLCFWLNFREHMDISKMLIRKRGSDKDPLIRVLGGSHSVTMKPTCDFTSSQISENTITVAERPDAGPTSKITESVQHHEEASESKDDFSCSRNQQNEEYQIDRVLIGHSRPHHDINEVQDSEKTPCKTPQHNGDKVTSRAMLIQQCRLNWDDAQGRFLDKWEMRKECINLNINSTESMTNSSIMDDCFHLSWRRSSQVSERRLSRDASSTGSIVLGTIDISIPSVIFIGVNTCADVSECLQSHFRIH